MKKLLSFFFLTLLAINTYADGELKLAWNHDDLSALANFRVYISEVSGDYTNFVEVLAPQLETTIENLKGSTQYFFVVTAVDIVGLESSRSNEITYKTSVAAPYNLRIIEE